MTQNYTPQKGKKKWVLATAAVCLALVIAGVVLYQQLNAGKVASVISLDVNPSIELTVDSDGRVISAVPKNDDAVPVLEGMELEGTRADVAMNAVIGSLLRHGYVDELANSILITVEDGDQTRGEKLRQELTAQAQAALSDAQVNGAILAQNLRHDDWLSQKAEEYGISAGKAALIETIVEASGGVKTFEELAGLSVNELNLICASQTSAQSSGAIQASGTASQGAYIGADAAKKTALDHAGLSAAEIASLEVDYDWEHGRMVYELEFVANRIEYEYEIDAVTGDVVKFEHGQQGTAAGGADPADYIGETAAKAAALSHAGVKESDAVYCNAWLEYDDGRPEHYEVKFAVGTTRYEYEIALTSATILKQEQRTYSSGSGGSASAGDVGLEAAKAAALKHAGVNASEASFTKTERDRDDGRLEYELEFWAGATEYEYTVAGWDGAVLDFDIDRHGVPSGGGTDIGGAKAKSIALTHAGVSESRIRELEVNRDDDDGRLEYEVEFKADGRDYEYTIDGNGGAILSYETD